MAIYHMSGQIISRISPTGSARSVISAAAYRSGDELHDEFNNETKLYRRAVMPESIIIAPEGLPNWVYNRERLWNAVEASEKQYNAQLAREFNIALPLELSSEEQKRLALDFCTEAFVNQGMIADISIHKDHEKNPHFHVMLTMRQMREDGSFMPKCRKEYVLDEYGNKIMLPSGNYKSIRVNTNDWNDKNKIVEWRKLWEIKANEYLQKNKIKERISCESNVARKLETEPTIHEGYGARILSKSNDNVDRINININIKSYNKKVIELQEYKLQKLSRFFSPHEKKILSDSAKILHTYIDINTILEKEKLYLTYERHSFNHGIENIDNIYEKQETAKLARDIIEKEASTFFKKYYPGLQSDLSNTEMALIVQKTTELSHLMSSDEMNNYILEIRQKEFDKALETYLKPESTRMITVLRHIEYAEHRIKDLQAERTFTGDKININELEKIDRASGTYHIYQDKNLRCFIGIKHDQVLVEKHTDYMNLHEAYNVLKDIKNNNFEKLYEQNKEASKIGMLNDRIARLENVLLVMDKLYDKAISVYYPEIDTSKMSTLEKEYVLGITRDDSFENNKFENQGHISLTGIISNMSNQGKMHEIEIERIKAKALKREVERERKRNDELENSI